MSEIPEEAPAALPAETLSYEGSTAAKTPQKATQFTSRNPSWTYLKLQLINQPNTSSTTTLDALTARTLLTSALSQFLGLTGTAIPIDILKISSSESPSPQDQRVVWIRVPREDASAVVAALSSWIGGSKTSGGGNVAWRVCAKGNFWVPWLPGPEAICSCRVDWNDGLSGIFLGLCV
ncbi:hypothetical protein PHISP_00764 [Aspergillus sp. HF37]|nr:hypothetical protein PHISP_00764 [Aspergillus sp. HF37]